MLLTEEGKALFRYCEGAASLEGEFLSKIDGKNPSGVHRIVIQGPTSIMRSRIIPATLNSLTLFPSLRITYQIDDKSHAATALKTGQVDFEILEPQFVVNEFESKLLRPVKYVLVGPFKWKGRKIKDIVSNELIVDFDPSDSTTFRYLDTLGMLESARKERHFVNNNESLVQMIQEGHGYGVLSHEFASPLLEQKKLCVLKGDHFLEHKLAVAWYLRPEMPKWFESVLKCIK